MPQLSYRISSPTLQPLLSLGPVRECVKDVRLVCVYFFYVCGFFTFFIGLSINIDALDSDFAHFGRLDPSAPGKQCGLCKWLLNSHEDLLSVQTHLIMFLSDCLQLAHQSQETGFRVKRIRQQVFGQGSAVLRCPVWCFHAHADYARWRSHLFRS